MIIAYDVKTKTICGAKVLVVNGCVLPLRYTRPQMERGGTYTGHTTAQSRSVTLSVLKTSRVPVSYS